jgi:hypothetical protein
MLFAPAMNASACSALLRSRRPADSRTTVRGITMRAVAMQRTRSSPEGGAWFCKQQQFVQCSKYHEMCTADA